MDRWRWWQACSEDLRVVLPAGYGHFSGLLAQAYPRPRALGLTRAPEGLELLPRLALIRSVVLGLLELEQVKHPEPA